MNSAEFAHKWKQRQGNEKSEAHPWFYDLCALLDVPTPTDSDDYMFEEGVKQLTGKSGYADVWLKGYFAWEFKSRGASLDRAYEQLKGYAQSLSNPPLLVVSDFDTIIVRTNFTNTRTDTYTITLDTIGDPKHRRVLRALWNDPASLMPEMGPEDVTKTAAEELGAIALNLRDRGVDPHEAAHFTVELLFCFFAEDIGLLPKGLFSQLLDMGKNDPEAFTAQLEELLRKMATGGHFGVNTIPHFNGGLFDEIIVEPLTADEIERLRLISALDWRQVEPAIFGTIFERSLDPARRSQLGAHYTGEADIDRVVEPVVMAPLRRRWAEVQAEAEPLVATWKALREEGKTAAANKQRDALQGLLDGYLAELKAVTILDPACGSGNFLYVALRKLMDLEQEVITFAGRAGLTQTYAQVGPEQVLGLEINEYAVEITKTVVSIGFLQWRINNGYGTPNPVLQRLDTIRLQDALLDLSDPDNPKEAEWPAADYIVGNPPFLGSKLMRTELGDQYVDDLFGVFDGVVARESDLCCYFFEQARQEIEAGITKRGGLLATNSIRGGANRKVLQRIKETGDIFMAWSDEEWVLDGAAVRISIVGFGPGETDRKTLDGWSVDRINADLTSAVDLTTAFSLPENRRLVFMGDTKGGPFDIDREKADLMLASPINPNGRRNSDVVLPYLNAFDVMRRSRDVWIVDFGPSMSESAAALYELPFEHVRNNVLPTRLTNKRAKYREKWWLHVEPRPGLRDAVSSIGRFIITPAVAKFRVFAWAESKAIPDHALFIFAREDDYFFGVLHSRAHEVWSLRMGTWLGKGNDPRYTPTTCFETFPFPWPPGTEPVDDPRVQAIAAAAKELDDRRRAWLDPSDATDAQLKKLTLTNLYNRRPTWLQHVHANLDRTVWNAYGWPEDEIPAEVEEEVILERLLALNLERAAATPA